jgi:ketosteroid isomerase-like protein
MVASADAEVVRRYFEAWNGRDLPAMEEVLGDKVEWERSADFPEGRSLRGREAILDFARSMFEVFAETPIEVGQCIHRGGGQVVVTGTTRFKGGKSGAETSSDWVRVYEVRERRIVRIWAAAGVEEALGSGGRPE